MITLKRNIKIPSDRIVKLKIPETVPINERVEVIMNFNSKKNSYKSRIKALDDMKCDKIFLEDIKHIAEDFKHIDSEGWD
ncbi:MAG: hypothetical protein HW421_3635 [Ignavibacteria bacterium]|nr:hypothetical protein [Ignavibacteria bacterium]